MGKYRGVIALLANTEVQRTCLARVKDVQAHNVQVESARYHGREATRVPEPRDALSSGEDKLAISTGARFRNNLIDIEAADRSLLGAQEQARGFAGLTFRVALTTTSALNSEFVA